MKKLLAITVATVMALCIFTGCAKKEETTATEAASETTDTADANADSGVPKDKGTIELGDYKGIKVIAPSSEVSDKLVEDDINYILKSKYTYEPVEGRAAQLGDTVNIDYEGSEDGVAFAGGTAQGSDLELGSHTFVANFEDECVGLKVGDEKTFDLTFPENYAADNLAGHTVQFKVKVNEIKKKVIPELTDEWVKEYTEGAQQTVAEYKKYVRELLEEQLASDSKEQAQLNALDTVIQNSKLKVNAEAVEEQFQQLLENSEQQIAQYNMTLEQYAQAVGMDLEEYKSSIRNNAEELIKQALVIDAIFEKEKMEITDEDYQFVADYYNITVEDLKAAAPIDIIDEAAKNFKVSRFLYDNAELVEE